MINNNKDTSIGLTTTQNVVASYSNYVIGDAWYNAGSYEASLSTMSGSLGITVTQVGTTLSMYNNSSYYKVLVTGAFIDVNSTYVAIPGGIRYVYFAPYTTVNFSLASSVTISKVAVIRIITNSSSSTIDIIDPQDVGTLYFNPYNIEVDASGVSSYNSGGTYFGTITRTIT